MVKNFAMTMYICDQTIVLLTLVKLKQRHVQYRDVQWQTMYQVEKVEPTRCHIMS